MSDEQISKALDNLLKFDEIHASMVARRNMPNIMPSSESFKPGVNKVWDATTRTTDKVFDVIQKWSAVGLGKIKICLQDYNVLFYVFPDKENVLISVTPIEIPNIGLLEIEIEKTRREILKIMEE